MFNEFTATFNRITEMYNDAHNKAVQAYKRGDVQNYNKHVIRMKELEGLMAELNMAMNV